jgi:hypothetical protein
MRVLRDGSGEYPDDLSQHVGLEDFDDGENDRVIYQGYNCCRNAELLDAYKESKKIFVQMEQPCGFMDSPGEAHFHFHIADKFDSLYTTCPLTGKWLNKYKNGKYKPIFHPYPLKYAIKEKLEKDLDAICWGNVVHQDNVDIVETVSKFKYAFYTLGLRETYLVKDKITGVKVPREQIWNSLRRSKVVVSTNILYINPQHAKVIKSIPTWKENEAFSHIDEGLIPQIKTRCVEGVFNKCIPLIKKDPWNLFSLWFTEGRHFFYYDTVSDLEEKIREISENWHKYEHMTEEAYHRAAILYSTETLFRDICINE